jgi:hypothetical protein
MKTMRTMKLIKIATAFAAAAVLCGAGAALAQTPPMKTIGTPAAAAKPDESAPTTGG